jgi:hypothetical protein
MPEQITGEAFTRQPDGTLIRGVQQSPTGVPTLTQYNQVTLRTWSTTLATLGTTADIDVSALGHHFLQALLNISAIAGVATTLIVAIDGKDAAGNYYPLGATVALSVTGATLLEIGLGAMNSHLVPATVRMRAVLAATSGQSVTFTAQLVGQP